MMYGSMATFGLAKIVAEQTAGHGCCGVVLRVLLTSWQLMAFIVYEITMHHKTLGYRYHAESWNLCLGSRNSTSSRKSSSLDWPCPRQFSTMISRITRSGC